METATFAGGCFWCTEAIFKRLKGVDDVISGYAGGKRENPNYEQVVTGATGHAEAIQIEFDPKVISYKTLLEIFFHLHDPTTVNRQGNDEGTQYRSVIFYHSQKQQQEAEQVREEISESGLYQDSIVTELVPYTSFYPAEDYHQNYYEKNPNAPYCSLVIGSKIQKLLKEYDTLIQDEYKV